VASMRQEEMRTSSSSWFFNERVLGWPWAVLDPCLLGCWWGSVAGCLTGCCWAGWPGKVFLPSIFLSIFISCFHFLFCILLLIQILIAGLLLC
jgi:hypothetical protein